VLYHEKDKQLEGVWEVVDMGNLLAARLSETDGPPMYYVGQEGSLTYNLSADGTLLVAAGEFAVAAGADDEFGQAIVTILLEGMSSGTWTADAKTLNLNVTNTSDLEAIFSYILNGQELGRSGMEDAERFLPGGSMGYSLSKNELQLFPVPGYPSIVLNRIG
jgi:hypothetical protein